MAREENIRNGHEPTNKRTNRSDEELGINKTEYYQGLALTLSPSFVVIKAKATKTTTSTTTIATKTPFASFICVSNTLTVFAELGFANDCQAVWCCKRVRRFRVERQPQTVCEKILILNILVRIYVAECKYITAKLEQ